MTQILNESYTLNLEQAINFTVHNPSIRTLWQGEPGVGKSSGAEEIARRTGFPLAMVDVPNLDLGDVSMPVVDHTDCVMRYYPNARFALHHGNPVVICLDEFTKGAEPVKNMLHPMLETSNPRLGDLKIPNGSIIYMTGNKDDDGVGDSLQQHTRQRVVPLTVYKPNAEQWNRWAQNNGIATVVMAWVDRYKYCLASYMDGELNEFNFNPAEPQNNVVSPRTLEIASRIILQRHMFDTETLLAGLAGAIGAPAAESIISFIRFQDSLPSFKSIVETPTGATLPEEPGARAVLTFALLEYVEKDNLTNIMHYLRRMEEEWQIIFGVSLARHTTKKKIAFENREFALWAADNEDLL